MNIMLRLIYLSLIYFVLTDHYHYIESGVWAAVSSVTTCRMCPGPPETGECGHTAAGAEAETSSAGPAACRHHHTQDIGQHHHHG